MGVTLATGGLSQPQNRFVGYLAVGRTTWPPALVHVEQNHFPMNRANWNELTPSTQARSFFLEAALLQSLRASGSLRSVDENGPSLELHNVNLRFRHSLEKP